MVFDKIIDIFIKLSQIIAILDNFKLIFLFFYLKSSKLKIV